MSKTLRMLVLMLMPAVGTGCCWFHQCFDQCGQCGGAYDPCTGLVYNQCDPYQGCRSKRISKKLQKDRCDCGKHDCNCHHDSHDDGGCNCNHGMQGGMMYSSGCPDCESYGTPIYGEPIYGEPVYGEPVYGEPVETWSEPANYPELMVPHDARPSKLVPAPPAEEPKPLQAPEGSSIPPTSYEVPAPLEGPGVPVLQPYHGR